MLLRQQRVYRVFIRVLFAMLVLVPMACNSSDDSEVGSGPTKSWTHPADLSDHISPAGEDADDPRIAMDAAGDALVAWFQYDGSDDQIFISAYRNSAWGHPADLSDNISPDGYSCEEQEVAMDAAGNAIVVWAQSDGSNAQIFMSEYRNSAWSHPADLSDNISPDGQNAYDPQVAMDGSGNAIVVWRQSDGTNNQIYMSEYRNGGWNHPASLSDNISPDGMDAYSPRVAMNAAGDAIVAWEQNDGSNRQIFISEYRSGSWTHPATLSDNISPDGGSVDEVQVAMDAAGDAIVVWIQEDGLNEQIFMSAYRNSAWTHPVDLDDSISPDGSDADDPQVAMDADGNAVLVWEQLDGTTDQIYMSEFRNDTWNHPADLNDNISPDGSDAGDPQVAMDGAGNAIVAWWQDDGSNDLIFMSEYR